MTKTASWFIYVAVLGFALPALPAGNDQPLTLQQARQAALQNHPRITGAAFKALAARQAVREVQSAYFPTISANVVAVGVADKNTRLEASGGLNNPSIFERNAEGLTISQIITDFGRTANLSGSSKLHAQAEESNAQTTRAQILLQVDAAYYNALQSKSVSRVATETVSNRQLFLDQVSALASNKLRSDLDVSFARVNLEESKLFLLKAQNDTQAARSILSILMGSREMKPYQLVEEPMPAEVGTNVSTYIAQALENRPDLQRLRQERDAALKFSKAERALQYPIISAVGNAGVSPIHEAQLPDRYAAAGVTLTLPLFAGNLYSAREKEAALKAKAAESAVQDEENNVIREVRITWLNLQNSAERLRIADRLRENAVLSYQLAQARYDSGASSIVELNRAQLNKVSAEITSATTKYDYLLQVSVLRYQSGAQHEAVEMRR